MRPRRCVPLVIAVTLVAACWGSVVADPRPSQTASTARPLELDHGGRWIGNAICYGPHRDGQRPGGPSPTAAEITEDLQRMAAHWSLLRVYGSSESAQMLLTIIRNEPFDMKVMLGAWIGPADESKNRREVGAAIRLANAFPDVVVAVSIGNETQVHWSAHKCPVESLIDHVRRARANVDVPVTVADDYNFWNKPDSRVVAAEVDFITLHAHPLWNGIELEQAVTWLRDQRNAVQELHPKRAIVIGETGWATSVSDEGEQAKLIKGRTGELEQKQFYDAVRVWAENERQPVFFFEAFDENWKGGDNPAEVEKHWGVFRADRTAKAAVDSNARK